MSESEEEPSSSSTSELHFSSAILSTIESFVRNPLEFGTFATGGQIDATIGIPAVWVTGVGRIGYPLCTQQSAALVAVATQAPFGRGTETVVDVDVRKVWQIDTNLITIHDTWMKTALPKIVSVCCSKLGIDSKTMGVQALFYKMLLYEKGGHFKKHRDTEKEKGMFGSLLIQLPAEHEGGALVVEHGDQKQRFEFCRDSGDMAFFASFYADCEHLLEPVTDGLRLVLAFNLVRAPQLMKGVTVEASAEARATERKGFDGKLAAAVRDWCADPNAVPKYVYPLEHKYTPTNVSFMGLKGKDWSIVKLLQNAIDPSTFQKLFTVHLALVTKHASGQEEDEGCMWSDDVDVSYETETWIGPHGAYDLGALSIDFDTEVITQHHDNSGIEEDEDDCRYGKSYGIFGDNPDRTEAEGYQGNYPGTLEFWYHSAVVVFWPVSKDFDIKLSSNPTEAVSVLENLNCHTSAEFTSKYQTLLTFLRKRRNPFAFARILKLAQDLAQVKAIFAMSNMVKLDEDSINEISNAVHQYGMTALAVEFTAMLSTTAQSITVVLRLLEIAKQLLCPPSDVRCSNSSSNTVERGDVLWNSLVQLLVKRMIDASKHVPPTDSEYVKACNFAITECDIATQSTLVTCLEGQLKLASLNNILLQITDTPQSKHLVDSLKQACISQCLSSKPQSSVDWLGVLRWVIPGGHAELMAAIVPKLIQLSASPELFRLLFVDSLVCAELQRLASPISQHLRSIVKARIAAITANGISPPVFSWCMPDQTFHIPEVAAFLHGPQQEMTYHGVNDLKHARNWANKHFLYNGTGAYVTATPGGRGQSAYVTLTKNKSHHTRKVQISRHSKARRRLGGNKRGNKEDKSYRFD